MDLNYLRRLVKIFDDSTLDDLEIDEEGTKIKFSRKKAFPQNIDIQLPHQNQNIEFAQPTALSFSSEKNVVSIEQSKIEAAKLEPIPGLIEFKSPIVGTFYRAPSPEASPFVEIGQHISRGQSLCIIEAMKLMNQIESEVNGTIEQILVENGHPVEFGQPLFLIKLD